MGLLAVVISIVALLAALANDGYLALLGSAAAKRPGASEIKGWVKGQVPPAAGATLATLLAWLLTNGGSVADTLAIVIAVAGGAVATRSLRSTQNRFPTSR